MQSQDNMNDHVAAALRALAEQDREREAPLHVEDHVRRAFRNGRARRPWSTFGGWGLAAAAAVAIVALGVREPRPVPAAPQRVAARPPQLAVVDPPPVETPVAEPAAPANARRSPLARPAPPQTAQSREVVTEFFPLLDVAPPFERGELLRVTVPMATMRKVGLPVNEDRLSDRVYADVLVGEEGLARAIRFVSYE